LAAPPVAADTALLTAHIVAAHAHPGTPDQHLRGFTIDCRAWIGREERFRFSEERGVECGGAATFGVRRPLTRIQVKVQRCFGNVAKRVEAGAPELIPSVQTDNGGSQAPSTATPAPTNDDNGLHLGQTKQPTSEPNKNEK
jgi:hypothetical protein